ncbi:MAG: ATP-dependent DNA helicase RecG, partial [Planctomycetota bacterium]
SERAVEAFARLGVASVLDLLRHYPSRYEREAAESGVAGLPGDGAVGSVRGEVTSCQWTRGMGRRPGRFAATLRDEAGETLRVTWFNMRWLADRVHPGDVIRVQGKVKRGAGGGVSMSQPRWEAVREPGEDGAEDVSSGDGLAPLEDRWRAVYPATEGLPSWAIEKAVGAALDSGVLEEMSDPLPAAMRERLALPGLSEAWRMIHRPADMDASKSARRRLAFNELFLLQLGIAMKRRFNAEHLVAPALERHEAVDAQIAGVFPFSLTEAQRKAVGLIADDLARDLPMNRLLQGDVGAGKTVVALDAMLRAVMAGKQAALVAPTELLAEQHYASIRGMLASSRVSVGLVTGATAREGRAAEWGADVVVGTHAVRNRAAGFRDLAVVVIDEQHRFGVGQRGAMRGVGKRDERGREVVPHHLVMTATPIPRSMTLTVFGDLDVATIDQLPPGRTPVVNRWVGREKRDEVYGYLKARLERGEQAYVVVPLVGEERSDELGVMSEAWETQPSGPQSELASVKAMAKELRERLGPEHRVAAAHGRLKRTARERVMDAFRRGDAAVLVATTVIEVGIDVPNATAMVIEHAERFGLAQLHQLRGRVGRNSDGRQSLCVFVADPTTDDAQRRLEAITSTTDGFRIAELDLEIRGTGELFGTRQHGALPLRIAELGKDMDLLSAARREARALIDADPELKGEEHATLRRLLMREYGATMGLVDVG